MFTGKRNPNKATYTLRYNDNIMLIRVDIGYGGMHTNPDGTTLEPNTPHIHIYNEKYGDKIAHPLPKEFSHTGDIVQTLIDFLKYSHIINVNQIKICVQGGLFK